MGDDLLCQAASAAPAGQFRSGGSFCSLGDNKHDRAAETNGKGPAEDPVASAMWAMDSCSARHCQTEVFNRIAWMDSGQCTFISAYLLCSLTRQSPFLSVVSAKSDVCPSQISPLV